MRSIVKNIALPSVGPALVLCGLAVLVAVATLVPAPRLYIRSLLNPDFRKILSSVQGDVFGSGVEAKVLKVETSQGLFLEIYDIGNELEPSLFQRIQLQDKADAHFLFKGESSNLILDDVNHDGRIDILAPSFDKNFSAHLNVFTFNQDRGLFEILN